MGQKDLRTLLPSYTTERIVHVAPLLGDWKTQTILKPLAIKNNFFIIRVEKHWHRFLTEVLDVPSLETFKDRLERALINMVK